MSNKFQGKITLMITPPPQLSSILYMFINDDFFVGGNT